MTRVRDVCEDEDEGGVDVLHAISLIFHEEKGCLGCPIVALEVWSNLVPTWESIFAGRLTLAVLH